MLFKAEDLFQMNRDWLKTQPETVQRKYPRMMAEIEGRDPNEVQPRRRQGRRTPNTTATEFHVETGATTDFVLIARAAQALQRISPDRADRYETWVDVGMALSEVGRLGYGMWEEWSKRSAKFQPGACAEKWTTFAPGDGWTVGSLERWADEDNPRPEILADGCTATCPNRPRVAAHASTIKRLEQESADMRDRNRFVTNAQAATGIKSASMRDTVVELQKEIERVPVEDRRADAFVPVRPAYMATMARSSAPTISRHLRRLEDNGIIERKVETTSVRGEDGEMRFISQTFVRPKVDLADPSVLIVPSSHGGTRKVRCINTDCGSSNIVDKIQRICLDCNTQQGDIKYEYINEVEESDVEDLGDPAVYAAAVAAENGASELAISSCSPISNDPDTKTTNGNTPIGLQDEIAPRTPRKIAKHAPPVQTPIVIPDASSAPGVKSGLIPADDPWFALQQTLARKAAGS